MAASRYCILIVYVAATCVGAARISYGVELASVPPATTNAFPLSLGGWTAVSMIDGSTWAGISLEDVPAPLDSDGWPTCDAYVVMLYAPPSQIDPLHFTAASYFGKYDISWHGNATLILGPGANATIIATSFNASTLASTATVLLGPPLPALVIGFVGTRRNASAGIGTGVTAVRIWQPSAGGAASAQVFTQSLLAALEPFAHVRTMQWTSAWYVQPYDADPTHGVIGWASRALPSDALWLTPSPNRAGAAGAPWETVVVLAQESGRGIWINVPVQIDGMGEGGATVSTYVSGLALLLRDGNSATGGVGVAQGTPLYVEYGNEVWLNGSSAAGGGPSGCYAWNKAAAVAEVARGGSDLNADGEIDAETWAYRRALRSLVRIATTMASSFGGSAGPLLRPVLGWHAPFAAEADRALAWMNATLGVLPSTVLWGIAINAYVVIGVTAGEGEAAMGADWQATSDAARPMREAAAAVAARWGLSLATYEGSLVGIPVGDPSTINATTAAVITANRGATYAAAMLHDARTNWEPLQGSAAYNFFALASTYGEDAPVQQFQWGLLEDVANTSTSKMNAVRQLVNDQARR